jgi:hypothetical protein
VVFGHAVEGSVNHPIAVIKLGAGVNHYRNC